MGLLYILNAMDADNIASSFKLFSKLGDTAPETITKSIPVSSSFAKITEACVFIGAILMLGVLYYYKSEILQYYDSNISGWVSKLWIITHLNSNGELATTYVPSEFSLTKWPF